VTTVLGSREPRPFTGSRDFLEGAESRAGKKIKGARAVAAKHYLVGAGARAGKNHLKTAPRSREMEPLNFFLKTAPRSQVFFRESLGRDPEVGE
jgi:hypothetical protein